MQLTTPGPPSRGAGSSDWVSRRLWERPHHHHEVERELELADDLATLSLLFIWFVLGANGLPRGDFTNHQLEAPQITKFKRHKLPILT